MTKKIRIPKGIKARGYSGVWNSPKNYVGWRVSEFLAPGRYNTGTPNLGLELCGAPQRVFLCDFTITPVLNKRGRPICRIVRPKEGK